MDTELSSAFLEAIPRAMAEIRTELRQSRSSDLTVPQFRLLAQLAQAPKNNKQLAEDVGVSVASMSRMVQNLTTRNLVSRTQSRIDRRESLLTLTPKGEAVFESIRMKAREGLKDRFISLSASEKESLQTALKLMKKLFFT